MHRCTILIAAVLVCAAVSVAQTAPSKQVIVAPKQIEAPERLKRFLRKTIEKTETVDFSGDGKPDWIATMAQIHKKGDWEWQEVLWVDSSLKVVKRTRTTDESYDFRWFVQLEDGPPNIIGADGDEDGIEYAVYRQHFGEGAKDQLLFLFDPVILDASHADKPFWGYPWDITDAIGKRANGHYLLRCSLDHQMCGDFADVEVPKWQKFVPALFFRGTTSQEQVARLRSAEVGMARWCSLDELAAAAHNPPVKPLKHSCH